MSSAHVSVCGKDVGESVEIVVEEETAERQRQQRRPADRRPRCIVDEEPIALVVIERHHLVGEVPDDEAGPSGAVVVRGVDAHAGARDAGLAEGDSRQDRPILERAVALVAVQAVRLGVVGDEDIDPPVAVEVEHGDAQSLRRGVDRRRPSSSRSRTCRRRGCERATGSVPCTTPACSTTCSFRRACRTDPCPSTTRRSGRRTDRACRRCRSRTRARSSKIRRRRRPPSWSRRRTVRRRDF